MLQNRKMTKHFSDCIDLLFCVLHVSSLVDFLTFSFAGDSAIDFLFDFLEDSQGPLGGLDVADNRPRAGKRNRIWDMPW